MPTLREPSRRRLSLVLAPALLLATAGHADTFRIGFPVSVSVFDDDCKLRMRLREGGSTLKVQVDGCYDVTDAENDIVNLTAGGSFYAEERRRGRTRQSIEIEAARDGTLRRTYERDGQGAPFDAAAQEWMQEVLRNIIRYSGTGLEQHIARVLKREGVEGALREIAAVDSDHAQRKAYATLLGQPGIEPATASRIAHDAGASIDSNHELAELLIAVAESPAVSAPVLVACADAAHAIDSDYEHRRALSVLVEHAAADASVISAALRGANDLDSDHERTELLRRITDRFTIDDRLSGEYFVAVRGIDSDYEAARALKGLVDRGDVEPAVLRAIAFAAGESIDSDYHKAEVLRDLIDRYTLDAATKAACLEAAKQIDSDHHRGGVLDALVDRGS